jgi:hypothetical protein
MQSPLLARYLGLIDKSADKIQMQAVRLDDDLVLQVPYAYGKFWTDSASTDNIHRLSYRACFKPALVNMMISQLSEQGDTVYDPFAGRGTVPVEACVLKRIPMWSDVNPLSYIYTLPRMIIPSFHEVMGRFDSIKLQSPMEVVASDKDLETFFHPETLNELLNIRAYLRNGLAKGDPIDCCIAMLVASRLHGNSPSYLSTFTMPASQAVNPKRQAKINEKYIHTPTYRSTRHAVESKYKLLFRNASPGNHLPHGFDYHCGSADQVQTRVNADLIVTSPPFVDEVDYKGDNWLRCWFLGIDSKALNIWQIRDVFAWRTQMVKVLTKLACNSAGNATLCWEVGEVRGSTIDLALHSAVAGHLAGWQTHMCLIHQAEFNKVSTTYGVTSNEKGTNENRILIMSKR